MKLFLKLASVVALMSAASLAAHADSTVPDASLAVPPGVYYGSGNTNGNFAITNTGGIELGLRAIVRNVGNITPDGTLYYAPHGTGSSGDALWNYDFSINLGSSGLTLSDIDNPNTSITIKIESTGQTVSYNPFILQDSPSYGGSPAAIHDHNGSTTFLSSDLTDIAFQNSENISFGFSTPLGFNPNAADVYDITLTVGDTTGVLATDEIEVSTAPLPPIASMGALMLGLVGLGAFFRFRKARKIA